jgi:hypothetical protein
MEKSSGLVMSSSGLPASGVARPVSTRPFSATMISSAPAASGSGASWSRGSVSSHWANVAVPSGPAPARVWLVVGSGRGDGPRFDPATLLATLGIDLEQIRRHVEAQFGPNAIHNLYASPVGWNLRPRRTAVRPWAEPAAQTRYRQRARTLLG